MSFLPLAGSLRAEENCHMHPYAIDRMVEERFLHPEQRNDLWHGDDLDAMVAWMRAYSPAQADKWMDEKRRKSLR